MGIQDSTDEDTDDEHLNNSIENLQKTHQNLLNFSEKLDESQDIPDEPVSLDRKKSVTSTLREAETQANKAMENGDRARGRQLLFLAEYYEDGMNAFEHGVHVINNLSAFSNANELDRFGTALNKLDQADDAYRKFNSSIRDAIEKRKKLNASGFRVEVREDLREDIESSRENYQKIQRFLKYFDLMIPGLKSMVHARNKLEKGDDFLYSGEYSRAESAYENANRGFKNSKSKLSNALNRTNRTSNILKELNCKVDYYINISELSRKKALYENIGNMRKAREFNGKLLGKEMDCEAP
ncbi:MAG: hypothetical protein ABEK59_01510 [Halobacteria archaeon]